MTFMPTNGNDPLNPDARLGLPQLGRTRPGTFQQGGVGRSIAGNVGDALLSLAGMKPIYGLNMQARPDLELERQIKALQLQRLQRPENKQVVNAGDGGIYSFDPEAGTLSQLATGTPKDDRTALERNFEWYQGLPEDQKPAARLMLPGAAYTLEVIQSRVGQAAAVANAQGEARARYRAPPKYEYRTGPNGELQRRRIG